jgi:hypothetical protein
MSDVDGSVVLERTLAFQVSSGNIQTTRVINSRDVVKDGVPASEVGARKRMIASPIYDKIVNVDNEFRGKLRRTAIPSLFKSGIYMMPLDLVDRIEDLAEKYEVVRAAAVETFMAAYSDAGPSGMIAEQEKRLGPLFQRSDYRSPGYVRQRFWVERRWISFQTPDKLKEISASVWRNEAKRASEQLQTAAEEIRGALVARVKAAVDRLVDRLTPGPDGKRQILKQRGIDTINEMLSLIPMQDVTGYNELRSVVDRIKSLTDGLTIDDLKKTPDLAAGLGTAFETISKEMDALVAEAPVRRICLDDEDDDA